VGWEPGWGGSGDFDICRSERWYGGWYKLEGRYEGVRGGTSGVGFGLLALSVSSHYYPNCNYSTQGQSTKLEGEQRSSLVLVAPLGIVKKMVSARNCPRNVLSQNCFFQTPQTHTSTHTHTRTHMRYLMSQAKTPLSKLTACFFSSVVMCAFAHCCFA